MQEQTKGKEIIYLLVGHAFPVILEDLLHPRFFKRGITQYYLFLYM